MEFTATRPTLLWGAVALTASVLLIASGCRRPQTSAGPPTSFPATHEVQRAALLAPEGCRTCHEAIFDLWKGTHHQLANRPVSQDLDRSAFAPAQTVVHGGVTNRMSEVSPGRFAFDLSGAVSNQTHVPLGVIGLTPLRQYLVPFPGGRLQTVSLSYDPARKDWFDMYGDEVRREGEWGHWTGQGMNWNANCAACHMTQYHKRYDVTNDAYASTWLHQGITCVQCHAGMEEHVKVAKPGDDTGTSRLTRVQHMEVCATCHARREELTPEAFKPGDKFDDHYRLTLVDYSPTYYPDGQVRDEDFEWTSFQMSRMGHKGITCFDCHEGHSMKPVLPLENNTMCLRCHTAGVQGAIVIQPEAHSFHKPGSTGNSCIECHMPKTTYMGRDPRREHGFTTPDPRMTKELGIPNACNTCHADKSVDWAVEWSEKWWGPKMERRQRERARVVAAMRHDTNSPPVSSLLALAETEEIAAWKAALGGMLGPFVDRPEVATYLRHTLTNASPLVRSSAVRGLSALPERDFLRPLLLDPVRLVRLDAALALPGALAAGSEGQRELLTYVNFTQDSVVGAFRRAQLALADGDKTLARTLAVRGAGMDRLNPDASVQAAVILSEAGAGPEAVSLLREAMGRSPTNATLPYTLALAVAEQGDTAETQRLLEQTVSLDPTHVRAWYNLSLARSQRGDQSAALTAVDRALALSPRDPEIMQAKASILHNLGRTTEAQAWLQRAQRAR